MEFSTLAWPLTGAIVPVETSRNKYQSEVDEIFIWTSDDRIWCIPSGVVSGMNQINLGKKYAEYEVTSHHVLVETKEQKTSYCKCGNIKKPQSGGCRDCANKNKKLGA